jgi:hypothetical protein
MPNLQLELIVTPSETSALWTRCEDARQIAFEKALREFDADILRAADVAHEAAKAIWNSWAAKLIREREEIRAGGGWGISIDPTGFLKPDDPLTAAWFQKAQCIFMLQEMVPRRSDQFTDFRGFIFPGSANFIEAKFRKATWFDGADFEGGAFFGGAHFEGAARFQEAKFRDCADFQMVIFRRLTTFENTEFKGNSDFTAASFERHLNLSRCKFAAVPKFSQASFQEAPDLDEIDYPIPSIWRNNSRFLPADYRAIRRLAIQGHDHENEAKAFKGEIRSRRFVDHMPWHPAYILGLIYDLVSDFGRSIMRPVYCWLILFSISIFVYLSSAQSGSTLSGVHTSSPQQKFSLLYNALSGGLSCSNDAKRQNLNPLEEAANLALRNGLLFIGTFFDTRLNQSVECLYGLTNGTPNYPSGMSWQTIQSLMSAPLIFLFLLAVRNSFKIR